MRFLLLSVLFPIFLAAQNRQSGPLYIQPKGDHSAATGVLILDKNGNNGLGFTAPTAGVPSGQHYWSLPIASAVGCWQDDGSYHLSVSACGGGASVAGGYIVTGSATVAPPNLTEGIQMWYDSTAHVGHVITYNNSATYGTFYLEGSTISLRNSGATRQINITPGDNQIIGDTTFFDHIHFISNGTQDIGTPANSAGSLFVRNSIDTRTLQIHGHPVSPNDLTDPSWQLTALTGIGTSALTLRDQAGDPVVEYSAISGTFSKGLINNYYDFIPNVTAEISRGTVNRAGTLVTRVTGSGFGTNPFWNNLDIIINGVEYRVLSVTDSDHLNLYTGAVGTDTGATYSIGRSVGTSANMWGWARSQYFQSGTITNQCVFANSSGTFVGVACGGSGTSEAYVRAIADCGMAVDGTTDDSTALMACINSTLPASGGTILIPSGKVKIAGATPVIITKNHVTILGVGGFGASEPNDDTLGTSTEFLCSVSPCITLQGATAWGAPYSENVLLGTGFKDIGFNGGGVSSQALKIINEWNAAPLINSTIRNFDGDYMVWVTGNTSAGTCKSHHLQFSNIALRTRIGGFNYLASGIRLGDRNANHEVCSMQFSNIVTEVSEAPGQHQILLDYADTTNWSTVNANGAADTICCNQSDASSNLTITTDGGGNATVTSYLGLPHHMPISGTDDGLFIIGGCDGGISSFGTCSGLVEQKLRGLVMGHAVSTTQIALTGITGLLPSHTYHAWLIGGTSININTNGGHSFSSVYTLNNISVQNGAGNIMLSGWDAGERCSFPCDYNDGYARLPLGVSAIDQSGTHRIGKIIVAGKDNIGAVHYGSQVDGALANTIIHGNPIIMANGTQFNSNITFETNGTAAVGTPTFAAGDIWSRGSVQSRLFAIHGNNGPAPNDLTDTYYNFQAVTTPTNAALTLSDQFGVPITRWTSIIGGSTANANLYTSYKLFIGTAPFDIPAASEVMTQFAREATTALPAAYVFDSYANSFGSGVFPVLMLRKCNGGVLSCTGVLANDTLGALVTRSYGSVWETAGNAAVTFTATENHSTGHAGSKIKLEVTPTGTSGRTVIAEVDGTGIHVNGDVTCTGSCGGGGSVANGYQVTGLSTVGSSNTAEGTQMWYDATAHIGHLKTYTTGANPGLLQIYGDAKFENNIQFLNNGIQGIGTALNAAGDVFSFTAINTKIFQVHGQAFDLTDPSYKIRALTGASTAILTIADQSNVSIMDFNTLSVGVPTKFIYTPYNLYVGNTNLNNGTQPAGGHGITQFGWLADSAQPGLFTFDTYANGFGAIAFPSIQLRRTNSNQFGGQVLVNDPLGSVGARGADSGGGIESTAAASLTFTASENHVPGAHGAYVQLEATANASASRTVAARFTAGGVTNFAGINTVGLGLPAIIFNSNATEGSTSIPVGNILVNGAMAPPGYYEIDFDIVCHLTGGGPFSGTVIFQASWNPGGTPVGWNSTIYPCNNNDDFISRLSSAGGTNTLTFYHNGFSHITISTSAAGFNPATANYDLRTVIKKLSLL